MDKKKVTELIQQVISNNVDSLEFGNDKHNAPLRKANSLLHDALIELGKSDWVSVEDELPPYDKVVWVTSKMSPDNVFKNRRVESTTVPKDDNDFIILWEGRMARITHWKPIDKLED
jgi:hypothetical protein